MYGGGRGVPHDDEEAIRWYRLAAEQGDDSAQSSLESMWGDGRGVADPDVSLRDLELGSGDLTPSPAFDPNVTSYTVSMTEAELAIDATTVRNQSQIDISGRSATGEALSRGFTMVMNDVTFNGIPRGSSFDTTLQDLSAGENIVAIVVTAEDGRTRTYTLVVCAGGAECGPGEAAQVGER